MLIILLQQVYTMTFKDLELHNNIQEAITEVGYLTPTPIQQKSIPIILAGEDLVGIAQTGTGKTAAFAIPVLNLIHRIVGSAKKVKHIRTLVITPTRELAIQIGENFTNYSKYTSIHNVVIFGGVNQVPQVDKLKRGVDVLIATPGRFLDLYKQGHISLDHMHQLIIDEADLMLDMGFINDVRKIIKLTPTNRQTLLFSATMPLAIRELSDEFLTKAKYVAVDPVSSAKGSVSQEVYFVDKDDKKKLLHHIIVENKMSNVLVFTRTKYGADAAAKYLAKNGIKADAIHGDKSQNSRVRVLDGFKDKSIDVLIATDVASRGIDIAALPYVINFDLPNIPETFVHRIGRTGRAGLDGAAISFCSKDEKPYLQDIEKLIKNKLKVIGDHPFPYKAVDPNKEVKPDLRGKKGSAKQIAKTESEGKSAKRSAKPKTDDNSRKSDASKKNKKRWY